jgi:uncharacterized membrane protein YqjE
MFDSDPTVQTNGGITGSVKRLLESGSNFFSTKLELVGVELQEEKKRILELMIFVAAALLFAVMALTLITIGIVAMLIERNLYAWVVAIGVFYFLIAAVLYFVAQKKVQTATKVFQTTVEELKKDAEWVKTRL